MSLTESKIYLSEEYSQFLIAIFRYYSLEVKNPIFSKNRIFFDTDASLKIRFFQKIGFF
jgi:hypothetical protein